ncbi:MAG: MBL fold metallo-hydrolase [Candidatus Bathyarchaeales archaeon]
MMIVKMLMLGALGTNCYVVWCEETKEAIVVDPAFSTENEGKRTVLHLVEANSLDVKYIVNTHGHADHTSGNGLVKKITGAPIVIHELDAPLLGKSGEGWAHMFGIKLVSPPADKTVREGEAIRFGKQLLRVIHTPGHTEGSISLVGNECVFVGDTLFQGSIGRTDFPGGSYKQIIQSIKQKLLILPDYFKIYTGHGPTTTIGTERKTNPFILAPEQYAPDDEE